MRKALAFTTVGVALAVGFAAAPAGLAAESHPAAIIQPASAAATQAWSLGTIRFINLQKGYGYISYAGSVLYFSTATVWGNWYSYYEGESVEFQASGGTAIDVHRFP
ncbi:hypothetical protein [Streptomyces sp. SID1034]|uniref:hypothetical protein n=1 Tax=Streptomyces sp. SID1034 TaxID=2690248 RepID=UPI00136BAA16|nr:hypothetical protein [Streptomyces sp. SID1034]MYV90462.1 hypothetical protein [Streptomyces sp. SID1034]